MNNAPFGEKDLENLLDRRGTDAARWPAAVRPYAAALLEASPRARALLAEARRLEQALDEAFPQTSAPAGLEARILAETSRRPAEANRETIGHPVSANAAPEASEGNVWAEGLAAWLAERLWRPVGLACAPLLVGLAMGMGFADDTQALQAQMLIAFSENGFAHMELGDEP